MSAVLVIALAVSAAAQGFKEIPIKVVQGEWGMSADGGLIAFQSNANWDLAVWDVPSWKPLVTLVTTNESCSSLSEIRFSEDLRFLVTYYTDTFCVWEPAKAKFVKKVRGEPEKLHKFIEKKGTRIDLVTKNTLLQSSLEEPNAFKFGEKIYRLTGVSHAAPSPDGKWLYAIAQRRGQTRKLHVIDTERGVSRLESDAPAGWLVPSADGGRLVAWDSESGTISVAETTPMIEAAQRGLSASKSSIESKGRYAQRIDEGNVLLEQGKPQEATASFAASLKEKPSLDGYLGLGHALFSRGEIDKAVAAYDKALEFDASSALAAMYVGVAKLAQGKVKEAGHLFDQALLADPKLAQAYVNRGVLRQGEGNLKRALADYDQAIALDPDNLAAYAYRGIVRYESRRTKEAKADLEAAQLSKDPTVQKYLAAILIDEGNLERAIRVLSFASSRGGASDPTLHFQLGLIQGKQEGHVCHGASEFNKAEELEPSNAQYKQYADACRKYYEDQKAAQDAYWNARFASITNDNSWAVGMSGALTNAARGIAAAVNTGGSGGGSGGSVPSRAGSGGGGSVALPSGAMIDPGKSDRAANETVRRNLNRQLWDMNNPFNRR